MNYKLAFALGLIAPGNWGGSEPGPTVSGVYVFADEFPYQHTTLEIKQPVNFVSNGSAWKSMYFTIPLTLSRSLYYYPNAEGTSGIAAYNSGLGHWKAEGYKTVDFGTTPQSVSEEFYTWLTANAVKQ